MLFFHLPRFKCMLESLYRNIGENNVFDKNKHEQKFMYILHQKEETRRTLDDALIYHLLTDTFLSPTATSTPTQVSVHTVVQGGTSTCTLLALTQYP
jgi:hypothetical protein